GRRGCSCSVRGPARAFPAPPAATTQRPSTEHLGTMGWRRRAWLAALTTADITAVVMIVWKKPEMGNLLFILGVDKARRLLTSDTARRRLNTATGSVLIVVGLFLLAG
ncbi:MAG: hypothetical protein VXW11_08635, partial [Pseudomonadota bacterium]|nr:hypothetical protein [Pseudomonadota bacterium]